MEQRLPEPPARKVGALAVWNGAIECRLLTYEVP